MGTPEYRKRINDSAATCKRTSNSHYSRHPAVDEGEHPDQHPIAPSRDFSRGMQPTTKD